MGLCECSELIYAFINKHMIKNKATNVLMNNTLVTFLNSIILPTIDFIKKYKTRNLL